MRKVMLASVALVCGGCLAIAAAPPQTPEQTAWYTKRNAQPLLFEVPAEEGDPAWSRAKLWLANYSDFKLQTIDEVILETFSPPPETAARFGCQVTRQNLPSGSWRIGVRCVTGNSLASHVAESVARSLAYYIRTGEDCPGCGGGRLGVPNRL